MKHNKKKGITLIESILSASVFSTIAMGVINFTQKEEEKLQINKLAEDLTSVVTAIDTRLSIDGYNAQLWNKTEWNDDEVPDELFSKELRPTDLSTCEGDWTPRLSSESDTELLSCNLWKNKIPFKLKAKAEITPDTLGFIDRFNLVLYFEDRDDFEKHYSALRKTATLIKGKQKKETAGNHFFEFVALDDTNTPLNFRSCSIAKEKCAFKASFNRSGFNETLRTDGQNSMVNSQIGFIEDELNAPLTCIRWKETDSGTWVKSLPTEHECGIGIYNESGFASMVEVNTTTGTFENILLEKQCKLFEYKSNTQIVEELPNEFSPCGMVNDGSEIYQVVETINIENGFFKNFYATELDGEQSIVQNIITERISADYVTIANDLEILQKGFVNDITINQTSTVESAEFERLEVTGTSVFENDLTFEDELTINNDVVVNDLYTAMDVVTNYSSADVRLEALNTLEAEDMLLLNQNQSIDGYCGYNGSLARSSDGSALNCINNKWIKMGSDSVPIGSISIWAGNSIPSGWLECNGQTISSSYSELRGKVGSTTPDLRGVFLRGLDEGTYRDDMCKISTGNWVSDYLCYIVANGATTRALGTYQMDENKRHRHTDTHFTGKRSARSGSSLANHSLTTDYTTTVGSDEMVPKNISLKYIIKAK